MLQELTTIEQWEKALEESEGKNILVFKHSTACPVSHEAWSQYQQYLEGTPNGALTYYFVKVIESRPISNQIAEDTGIKHESPQVLLIQGREAKWNTSHWNITAKKLNEVLAN